MRVGSTVLFVSLLAGCSTAVPGKSPGKVDSDAPTVDTQVDTEVDDDLDDDGHDAVQDCDDHDASVYPGAEEVPYDGIDQDCADGDLVDVDVDGADAVAVGGDDCDDADPGVHPGAVDVAYDGIDQNCVGGDLVDVDGDGVDAVEVGGADCDDADLAVYPDAAEIWYDGVDQNCDGACDGDQDGDGSVLDGWTVADGDICDGDPGVGVVYAPTDCDDTNPLAEALLVSTVPVDGAANTNPWRPLSATLVEVDPSGVLALADAAGQPVSGVSTWWGSTLEFTPAVSLEPRATYTAELTWGCGTQAWSFTTNDGTGQDFLDTWTVGPPDTLQITVVNPVARAYGFGMAETGSGAAGWYGEDCAGALATGSCHPMGRAPLVLQSVYPSVGSVVPGATTLFDASFDPSITYFVEARDGAEQGSCWTWGNDPSYFSACTPL